MRSNVARCTLLLALCCVSKGLAQPAPEVAPAAPAPAAHGIDPVAADRETLRRFLDEGPAFLLPPAERTRIAGLPLTEGLAAARAF
nr:hypothetical protein [Thermoanaerobaculia bacterium]